MFLAIATTYCCGPTDIFVYSIDSDTFLSLIPFKNCNISTLNTNLIELVKNNNKPIDSIMSFMDDYGHPFDANDVYFKYDQSNTVLVVETTCG